MTQFAAPCNVWSRTKKIAFWWARRKTRTAHVESKKTLPMPLEVKKWASCIMFSYQFIINCAQRTLLCENSVRCSSTCFRLSSQWIVFCRLQLEDNDPGPQLKLMTRWKAVAINFLLHFPRINYRQPKIFEREKSWRKIQWLITSWCCCWTRWN